MSTFVDFYELLGVPQDVDMSVIRREYIRRAKQAHPDAGGSTEQMQQLNAAYKTLSNQSTRTAYDMVYGYHHGTISPGEFDYTNDYFARDVTDMSDAEIDEYLDTLFAEYHSASEQTKHSFASWLKSIFA